MSYYRRYLQHLLGEWDEEHKYGDDFLDEKEDAAEGEYENARSILPTFLYILRQEAWRSRKRGNGNTQKS